MIYCFIYKDFVLTTTGFYYIKDNYTTVSITNTGIQNVKKISGSLGKLFILTHDNKVLLKKTKRTIATNAIDICYPLILHSDNTYTFKN